MLTLDRVLDELSQQTTDVTCVLTIADIELVVEPEVTIPSTTCTQFWFEPTVAVPMPWLRSQRW